MGDLDTLLCSFCCKYCVALDCADDADELPAMSSELAAMREEIEEFYQNFVDIQWRNGIYHTLAITEEKGYGRLTLSPGIIAELVKIHELMLLRECREKFRGLLQTRDAVEIRIVDDGTDEPFF